MTDKIERLKWLRDGCNWLVTVSAGLIVASATFYKDILVSNQKCECLIVVVWAFLLTSIVSGVLCYFSAFALINILVQKGSYELKGISWAGLSYSIMLFSFMIGVLFLVITLIVNKL